MKILVWQWHESRNQKAPAVSQYYCSDTVILQWDSIITVLQYITAIILVIVVLLYSSPQFISELSEF